jgi:IclR family pca regulon transcriptional regulator
VPHPVKPVGSLARGLRLLSIFGVDVKELGLSELAKRAELDKATTHRLARALTELGFLDQDPESKRYRLGVRVLDLGFAYLSSVDVRELALPHMQALARDFDGSVSLSILDDGEIVYVERLRPKPFSVSVQVHVGSRSPVYCTAMGKALLACLPRRERERILDGVKLEPLTPHTITDREALARQLEQVLRRGFALNDEEHALGLRSAAAAIRDRSGAPIAALNVAVSTLVPRQEVESRIAPRVVEAAAAVSAQLGWRPERRETGRTA